MSGDGEEEKHGSAATESNVTDCISPWPCMSLSSLRYRLKVTLVGSAKVNIISEMKVTREAYYLLLRVGQNQRDEGRGVVFNFIVVIGTFCENCYVETTWSSPT